MSIDFDHTPYVDLKGKQPSGVHLWRFAFRVAGKVGHVLNVDGEWMRAKDTAFNYAKALHGRDIVIEVYPY